MRLRLLQQLVSNEEDLLRLFNTTNDNDGVFRFLALMNFVFENDWKAKEGFFKRINKFDKTNFSFPPKKHFFSKMFDSISLLERL